MPDAAGLSDASLPAAYAAADQASIQWQSRALSYLRLQLLCGIAGAASGLTSWRWRDTEVDLLAGAGLAGFFGAAYFAARLADGGALRRWYEARAAAESLKTLAWRYSVCAAPFGLSEGSSADKDFIRRSLEVLDHLKQVEVGLRPTNGDGITVEMRRLRSASLEQRREAYRSARVEDQINWYGRKADDHAASQRRWAQVTLLANALGITAAVMRLLGIVNLDFLGVLAAVGGAATAWAFARQHGSLVAAYTVAGQELRLVLALVDGIRTEEDWAEFVGGAEAAISREHTMWLASRIGRALPR